MVKKTEVNTYTTTFHKDSTGSHTYTRSEVKTSDAPLVGRLFSAAGGILSGGLVLFFGWFMIVLLNRANSGLPYFGFRQFMSMFDSDTAFTSWFSNMMNDWSNTLTNWQKAMSSNTPSMFLNGLIDFFAFVPKILLGFFNICFQLSGFMADLFGFAFNFVGSLINNTANATGDALNGVRDANWEMWIS